MPVCGPGPRRYAWRTSPDGCSIANETATGLPARSFGPSRNPCSEYVFAAGIVGTAGLEPEPQPASAAVAAAVAPARSSARVVRAPS